MLENRESRSFGWNAVLEELELQTIVVYSSQDPISVTQAQRRKQELQEGIIRMLLDQEEEIHRLGLDIEYISESN